MLARSVVVALERREIEGEARADSTGGAVATVEIALPAERVHVGGNMGRRRVGRGAARAHGGGEDQERATIDQEASIRGSRSRRRRLTARSWRLNA